MRVIKSAFAGCVFVTYFSGLIFLSALGTRMVVQAMYVPPLPLL